MLENEEIRVVQQPTPRIATITLTDNENAQDDMSQQLMLKDTRDQQIQQNMALLQGEYQEHLREEHRRKLEQRSFCGCY